jgi:multidrug resistance efflux pump
MSQFQTVDQLQATIASQAAEIERLRKAITDEDGEMEIRRLRMQLIDIYRERNLAIAEVDRLRALVEEAYREGFKDEWNFYDTDFNVEVENGWNLSRSRAALQPKEG